MFSAYAQSSLPDEWNRLITRTRPRMVRLKKGYRFWCAFLAATLLIISSLSIGFLLVVWRTKPDKQTINPDLWHAIPWIVLPLVFLLLGSRILIGDRRLLINGEISIGKVTRVNLRRRVPAVTYEFVDRSGRLITASSPDNTRALSPGMLIAIFYDAESPDTDQVSQSQSAYEIAD
jgi:hypothetical protein